MTTPKPDRVILGISLMVFSVFMMSVQDGVFKHFNSEFSLWQIFTLRGLLAVPIIFAIGVWLKTGMEDSVDGVVGGVSGSMWKMSITKWPLIRSVCLTLMYIFMYASSPFLSLSTIAAGIYTSPIFITLISAYALGERVGTLGWIAIFMGFAGVLTILQPGSDAFSLITILPILGGLCYALGNVVTRSKCANTSVVTLTLSLNMALLLVGVLLSGLLWWWEPGFDQVASAPFVLRQWLPVDGGGWIVIGVLTLFILAISMGLAGAYQSAPASVVATFDYSYLVFVVLWDYLFFSVMLDAKTMLGMALIIAAGILAGRRKRSDLS